MTFVDSGGAGASVWGEHGAPGLNLVLEVPAKLAAGARVFGTGQVRKTDPADAHAIVMVALRDK